MNTLEGLTFGIMRMYAEGSSKELIQHFTTIHLNEALKECEEAAEIFPGTLDMLSNLTIIKEADELLPREAR